MSLRNDMIADLITIESDLGNPTFTWNNTTYNFIPSVTEYTKQLETGGFGVDKMLTATVRKLSANLSNVFSTYPLPEQLIIYSIDGLRYRILTIRHDPTGAYFRLIAVSEDRGI